MRHGRLITTLLAVTAIMAIGPAWAAAAPPPFVDDTVTDFAAGTTSGTAVVAPGSVRLTGTPVTEPFNGPGPALPTGFTTDPWNPGGTATVGGGALTVDGALVGAGSVNGPGQVLEFNATLAGVDFQNVGFGTLLNEEPWAIFGTSGPDRVAARTTLTGVNGQIETVLPAAINPLVPHIYRIEWSASDVKYFVDNAPDPVAVHPIAIASNMRPVVSDFTAADAKSVTVDSLSQTVFTSPGTFTSAAHDAGDPSAVWSTLTSTVGTSPAESAVTIKTQSSTDATNWSTPADLGAGGAIQSPPGRYIRYVADLSSSAGHVTPSLDRVQIDYIDTTGPSTAVDPVQVSGTTATLTFSSAAGDLDHFECSLDGGAFAACASPKAFGGLAAGSHTASVRGVDKLGNAGPEVAKPFTVDSPQGGGGSGGNQQSGGSSVVADTTAPKVSLVARSLRASKRGTVSFRVGCPATETRCKVQLQLKDGKKVAAKKTVTVNGGQTVTVTLQLATAARQALAKRGSLKVSTVFTATDAAGNHKTTTRRMTLRRAAA